MQSVLSFSSQHYGRKSDELEDIYGSYNHGRSRQEGSGGRITRSPLQERIIKDKNRPALHRLIELNNFR